MGGISRGNRTLDWALTVIGLAMLGGTIIWLQQENAQQFSGNARVIDGDSLVVDGREIRLQGIDAPEYRQICYRRQGNSDEREWRCGIAARDALRQLVRKGKVICDSSTVDQYERWLGTCRAGDVSINKTMVEQGWAVNFGGYGNEEREAEREKRGIWKSRFDRPNVWRELNMGSAADS